MYDALIIGCGFAGATVARKLAEEDNKKVLILEKRPHIGGNMYESEDTNGVSVHWYGPHIFHTNFENVFEYLKRFSDWFFYEHKVIGQIDGQLVPIPFNFKSLEMLFPEDKATLLKGKLKDAYKDQEKVSILDLMKNDDEDIKEFGEFVYEKVFLHYTAKQWNTDPSNVDKSVINRVPVVLGYDDRYFSDKIQYMPTDGFTTIFENMLDHENIDVELSCNCKDRLSFDFDNKKVLFDGEVWDKPVIFTGAIDELFDYKFGTLPYRSLDLAFEQKDVTWYQPASVVNYPNDEKFTRITEFKYLSRQDIEGATTILKEYPHDYDPNGEKGNTPYYPIQNDENIAQYEKYKELADEFNNIYLCGRLAQYKYYNMDAVINEALKLADEIKGK